MQYNAIVAIFQKDLSKQLHRNILVLTRPGETQQCDKMVPLETTNIKITF